MKLKIENIRDVTNAEWDLIWDECEYSTYFHSREWSEIWREYTGGEMIPNPQMISFSDGTDALLPLSVKKGFFRTYFSSPAGTYGGWISSAALNVEHSQLLARYMLSLKGTLFWRLNPYYPCYDQMRVICSKKDETHILKLDSDFDTIVNRSTKGHKSAAVKARREGVTSRRADIISDWEVYYELYEDSLGRWGDKATSRYSWRLFEIMASLKSDHIKLWLAEYHGKPIAGALCFYARKHVVYWHGAAKADFFHLRPVHLLIYNIANNALQSGAAWFDFNPSGGHEGVKAFKESFGAKPMRCPVVTTNNRMLHKIINKSYGWIIKK